MSHLITAEDYLAAVAGYAEWWQRVVGILPDAPPDTITWIKPTTLGDAAVAHGNRIVELHNDRIFETADGEALVIARALHYDPEHWCGDPSTVPDPDPAELQRLFDTPDEVGEVELLETADGNLGYSPGVALLGQLIEATGYGDLADEPPATSPAEFRARRHAPGRWVTNWLPGQPDAALWVRPYTKAERARANLAATYDADPAAGRDGVLNQPQVLIEVLTCVILDGPGGQSLLTRDQVRQLPYGGARLLYQVTGTLAAGGALPSRAEFRRLPRTAPALPADGPAEPDN